MPGVAPIVSGCSARKSPGTIKSKVKITSSLRNYSDILFADQHEACVAEILLGIFRKFMDRVAGEMLKHD